MRKLIFVAAMCGAWATPAMADTAVVTGFGLGWNAGSYGSYSGDFPIKTWGLNIPGLADGQAFTTFCVERDENVYIGQTYNAVISTSAIHGGGLPGSDPDPLDPHTAWLYDQYLSGGLGSKTGQLATDVGMAIWYLEQELGDPIPAWNALSATQQTLVTNAQNSPWTDIGPYRVLNLWGINAGGSINYTIDVQDALVRLPVPAAILIGLLGLGTAGLKLRKYA